MTLVASNPLRLYCLRYTSWRKNLDIHGPESPESADFLFNGAPHLKRHVLSLKYEVLQTTPYQISAVDSIAVRERPIQRWAQHPRSWFVVCSQSHLTHDITQYTSMPYTSSLLTLVYLGRGTSLIWFMPPWSHSSHCNVVSMLSVLPLCFHEQRLRTRTKPNTW